MSALWDAVVAGSGVLAVAGLVWWARRDRFATHVPPEYFD